MEVSVLPRSVPARPRRPRGGEEGRGAGAGLALAGSRWVGVGRRLPSARPRAGRSGRRDAGRLQPPSGAAGAGTGKCRGFRPRHAGAACCLRGRDVELRRGLRAGASRARDAAAQVRRPLRRGGGRGSRPLPVKPLAGAASSVPFTLPHMEPRLCRSPRLPSASRAQAGGGGPQRGVGTSRVTDLFEGDVWGRGGFAWTIFLYSSAVLLTSRALFQSYSFYCWHLEQAEGGQ